jgi:hypothetical protein
MPVHERLSETTDRWSYDVGTREFAGLLQTDRATRMELTSVLAKSRFDAFFWESKSTTAVTADQPFEFVLVDAPALVDVTTDPRPFAANLSGLEPVTTFPNIGYDAVLVVPRPRVSLPAYAHLARFVREAPAGQIDALWTAVGAAMDAWWARTPDRLWVSTSGLGVYWLHVRLDSGPKYYSHRPYRLVT